MTANTSESSFIVYRAAAIEISVEQMSLEGFSAECPPGQTKGSSGICCPYNPESKVSGGALCVAEFAVIVGAIVWGARWGLDAKKYPPCPMPGGPLPYCIVYSLSFSHYNWQKGCVCPRR